MSPPEPRAGLARAQAELLACLTKGGPPPAGFDGERLRVAAAALADKRRREVAHAWPALARALGEDFAPLFYDFAARVPYPARGGPLADGRAFARDLQACGALSAGGRLEALRIDLEYATIPGGLVRRRGPALRLALAREPRRLVVGIRLPGLGPRALVLPWW